MDIFEFDYWCRFHNFGYEIGAAEDGVRIKLVFTRNNQLHEMCAICKNEEALRIFKNEMEKRFSVKCEMPEQCFKCEHACKSFREFPCNVCQYHDETSEFNYFRYVK